MSLIEGIGDEVTHFFIALIVVIIGAIAWWTTGISEQRHIRTVFLLDRRHRTLNISHQHTLSNHTETITITEGSTYSSPLINHTTSSETGTSTQSDDAATSSDQQSVSKPASEIPSEIPSESSETTEEEEEDINDNSASILEDNSNSIAMAEQNDIIQTMDAEYCVVRQRRLAFYENRNETERDTNNPNTNLNNTTTTQSTTNNTNNVQNSVQDLQNSEENDIENELQEDIVMEHNYAEKTQNSQQTNEESNTDSISIKLKYINDDLKQVRCNLEDKLGDFKREHFNTELSDNKLIRLIFNGHVLHQDSSTLRSYGLFDNCVVHCLIHPKRHNASGLNGADSVRHFNNEDFVNNGQNNRVDGGQNNLNNNQANEWDLGNLLIALVTIILVFAWYLRYLYGHLYTVTATIGLILVTGIYAVVLIGMNFPDTEPAPARYRIQARLQTQILQ